MAGLEQLGFFGTAVGAGLLALIGIGYGWEFLGKVKNEQLQSAARVVGVIFAAVFLVAAGLFGGTISGGTGTVNPAGAPEYTVLASANGTQAHVTIDNVAHEIVVQLDFNTTSGALTKHQANIDFSIARKDTGPQDGVAEADVIAVGSVGNISGTGTTYTAIAKNSDGTYKTNWTRAASGAVTNKYATILIEGGGAAVLTFNVTANSDAGANMNAFNSVSANLLIGKIGWKVTFLMANRHV
jgi:hypothetical protein